MRLFNSLSPTITKTPTKNKKYQTYFKNKNTYKIITINHSKNILTKKY